MLPIVAVLVVAFALPTAQQAHARSLPLGAALWWACTQPSFKGPAPLHCKRGHDPR